MEEGREGRRVGGQSFFRAEEFVGKRGIDQLDNYMKLLYK